MDYRVGKCASCGARYKIPATFEGDKAKCKSCSGVVEVGPVQTPGSEPGTKPKAQPIPARKPAEKKERSGPSMKEKLKAQREAEASAAEPAAKAESKAQRSTSRRASSPRRARATAGGGDGGGGDEEPKSASKRTSARGGSRRRGRGGDGDDGDEPRSRRGRPQKKKANPAMFIGAIALVAIVAFGAWKFMGQGDDVEAGNGTDVASNADAGDGAAETATDGVADEAGGKTTALDAPTDDEGTGETADVTPEGGTEDGVEAPADDNTAATEEPVKPKPKEKVYDPSTVDLSAYTGFDKVEGTSDEEWAELQELAALMIDPEAGAAGSRAQKSLVEAGKAAMPAIINQLLPMDFSTEEGYRNGDICQKKLMEICNGINLGWKYSTTPKDQVFNKKAVLGWAKNWDKCVKDPTYWIKFAKLDKQETPAEKPVVSEDDLDDLDDL